MVKTLLVREINWGLRQLQFLPLVSVSASDSVALGSCYTATRCKTTQTTFWIPASCTFVQHVLIKSLHRAQTRTTASISSLLSSTLTADAWPWSSTSIQSSASASWNPPWPAGAAFCWSACRRADPSAGTVWAWGSPAQRNVGKRSRWWQDTWCPANETPAKGQRSTNLRIPSRSDRHRRHCTRGMSDDSVEQRRRAIARRLLDSLCPLRPRLTSFSGSVNCSSTLLCSCLKATLMTGGHWSTEPTMDSMMLVR